MQKTNLARTFTATAIAGALGVVAASPAGAVVYRSVFDPVSFEGTALFDVSQACLDVGTGFASNNYDGCTVNWLEAEVTLKDPTLTTLTETFQYHPTHLPSTSAVNSIFVQDGDLAGVSSDIIGPMTVSGSSHAPFDGPWWIQYTFGFSDDIVLASLGPQALGPIGGQFGYGEVLLWGCNAGVTTCEAPQRIVDTADVEFFRVVQVVPEPASGALAFAALWAAWFARRRIKRP